MIRNNYFFARIFSVVLALVLQIIPQPSYLQFFWPQWFLVVVLLWLMYSVSSFSFSFVFMVGLFIDLLSDTPLGLHGLGYVFVVYCVKRWIRQLGHFKHLQKALWLLLILLIMQTITFIIMTILSLSFSIFCYCLLYTSPSPRD